MLPGVLILILIFFQKRRDGIIHTNMPAKQYTSHMKTGAQEWYAAN